MPDHTGSTKKPEDMYRIIEHFALGKRRLELFGEDHNIRPGWLTLGKGLSYSNFNKEVKKAESPTLCVCTRARSFHEFLIW